MNNKAQRGTLGFALLLIVFLVIITSFATIEPLKEVLDDARDSSYLNCIGTLNFNQTAYDLDETSTINKLTRRPT